MNPRSNLARRAIAFGLRLSLRGTLVHEHRLRNQGMRAGLSGSIETSAFAIEGLGGGLTQGMPFQSG